MYRHIRIALLLALTLSLGLFGIASAHAKLVSSDPAAGARLTAAPDEVSLEFNEEISSKANESFFTVADASGAEVGRGVLDTEDLDRKTLTGALKSGLGDGIYTVSWQVVTPEDNGKTEGSFAFGVNADPGAQPTAKPHDEPQPTAAAQPTTAAAAQPAAQPAALPKTGAAGPDLSAFWLVAAVMLLAGGLALRRR